MPFTPAPGAIRDDNGSGKAPASSRSRRKAPGPGDYWLPPGDRLHARHFPWPRRPGRRRGCRETTTGTRTAPVPTENVRSGWRGEIGDRVSDPPSVSSPWVGPCCRGRYPAIVVGANDPELRLANGLAAGGKRIRTLSPPKKGPTSSRWPTFPALPFREGTDGSNPSSSREESCANLVPRSAGIGRRREPKCRRKFDGERGSCQPKSRRCSWNASLRSVEF